MAVKLGNGNWAVKEDKLLAYNDNSGLFFNKEFDFSRGTSATYVAKDGLIKTAGIQPNIVNNGDFSELGSELVINGDFTTDSDWTKGSGWSIANGKASNDGSVSGNDYLINSASTSIVGKTYKVVFTVSDYVQGNLRVRAGQASSTYINANGTYTQYQVSTSTETVRIQARDNFIGSIDNVSVKQVDPNDYWTVTNEDANNYVEFNQEEGTVRLKFLNTSPITTLSSATQYLSGKTYKLTVDVKEVVSGSIKVDAAGVSETFNSVGIQQRIIEPTGNSTINFYRATANVDITLNSVSLQEIQTDTPRIDFTNDTKGHLLLEPSRTNLITYSEDLTDSSWAKQSGGTGTAPVVTSNNTISPDGTQNADKVVFDKGTGTTTSDLSILSASFTSQSNTASFYIKADSPQRIVVRNSNTWVGYDIGTDWTRVEKTDTGGSIQIGLRDGYGVADVPNTATVYLWGVQVEAGSYATSYIPTTGAASTRNADLCNNSGSAQDFNSEEGVLYAEIAALADDGTFRQLTISDSSTSDRVSIDFTSTDNQIRSFSSSGGSTAANMTSTVTDSKEFNKVAVKYKLNDYALWINGSEVATDTSAAAPVGLQELAFDNGGGSNDFYGKVRNLQVFTEALTDEQLEKLTS